PVVCNACRTVKNDACTLPGLTGQRVTSCVHVCNGNAGVKCAYTRPKHALQAHGDPNTVFGSGRPAVLSGPTPDNRQVAAVLPMASVTRSRTPASHNSRTQPYTLRRQFSSLFAAPRTVNVLPPLNHSARRSAKRPAGSLTPLPSSRPNAPATS